MQQYKVSILIPIYKAANFIERCAESLMQQTFQSIEYIFVNDATPDQSIQILQSVIERYPKRADSVKILHNQHNMGISDSRQIAFDHATGEYFLAMDSDDYIEPNMIELLFLKAQELNADIVQCGYFLNYQDRETIANPKLTTSKFETLREILTKGQSAYWNKLIKRELLTSNNITTLKGVNMADDLVVLTKLIYHSTNIAYIPTPLYHYVQYNPSACTKAAPESHINDHIAVVQEVEQFLMSKPNSLLYQDMLAHFKALRKIKIVRASKADPQYLPLFPELQEQRKAMHLPLKSRIILRLAEKNRPHLSKLFLTLLSVVNKLTFGKFA